MKTDLQLYTFLRSLFKNPERFATRILLILALSPLPCALSHLSAQVPPGFNYQAIARDGSGNPIIGASIDVKFGIQADTSATPVIFWEEQHSNVKTNAFGMFTLVIGTGTQTGGILSSFGDIDWSVTPKFLKTQIYYQSAWKYMGSSRLWSVPYSMVAGGLDGSLKKLEVVGENTQSDEALFEVKRKDGETMFAVYNHGVRVYMPLDTLSKSRKGGFAIGGFDKTKSTVQDYFFVSPDSIRAYVDATKTKGVKGGFAIGGFGPDKATFSYFMEMTPKNYFIGEGSGSKNTTGVYNSFIGYQTGLNNSSGSSNALMGYQAGYSNNVGSSNLFLGYQSGYSNTNGNFNSFLGYQAGYANTTGGENTFLGSYSGRKNISGNLNTFLGYYAGYSNTTGGSNNFIGTSAGYSNLNGSNNVFLGTEAGYSNTGGAYNIFLGYRTGYKNTTGTYNAFIGYQSGYNNLSGQYSVFIGDYAGFSNNTGFSNVFIGYHSGYANTKGTSNVFIGNQAGDDNLESVDNVMIGYIAGQHHTTGNNNIFVGSRAGLNDHSGSGNIFMGYRAGEGNVDGYSNVFMSTASGYKNTSGYSNVLIGDLAGANNTSGYENVIIGRQAGYWNSTGNRNIMIGYNAGFGETGSNRLYIGDGSLIYGETDNHVLQFNGQVKINGNLDFITGTDRNISLQDHTRTMFFGGKGTEGPWAIYFQTDNGSGVASPRLVISGTAGHVAVNQNDINATYQFYVNGPAGGTSAWNSTSDARYKENIMTIEDPLQKVTRLRGVSFNFKDENNFEKGKKIGLIAQEVLPVVPEVVTLSEEGYTIQYGPITALLVEAVKEQQKQMDKCRQENLELKSELESLREEIKEIKRALYK